MKTQKKRIEDKNEKMEIVARNVISATAGYNYSLYLDTEGKVHFIGNSGIAFKERFNQGDLAFKKVFARRDIDIFGAEDIDENFYVWGDNHSEQLETKSETFLKELDIILVLKPHPAQDLSVIKAEKLSNFINKETSQFKFFNSFLLIGSSNRSSSKAEIKAYFPN